MPMLWIGKNCLRALHIKRNYVLIQSLAYGLAFHRPIVIVIVNRYTFRAHYPLWTVVFSFSNILKVRFDVGEGGKVSFNSIGNREMLILSQLQRFFGINRRFRGYLFSRFLLDLVQHYSLICTDWMGMRGLRGQSLVPRMSLFYCTNKTKQNFPFTVNMLHNDASFYWQLLVLK